MRFLLSFSFVIFLFSGCKQSAIQQSFSSADSLVIHFKNEELGTITKSIRTTDRKAINRIITFIDAGPVENTECINDGKMFFYKEGLQIQEVDFNTNEISCTQRFTFLVNGKLHSTKIKKEAIDFLFALEKGLPYY